MNKTENIINNVSHRPFDLPKGDWKWYQEWNNVVFLHWVVPKVVITSLIPSCLKGETFENQYWITLVAFSMENIRFKFTPSFPGISNFQQLNIRTYVSDKNHSGIYLLHVEAESCISIYIANILSSLSYEKATMKRSTTGDCNYYSSNNRKKDYKIYLEYSTNKNTEMKTDLINWLTERYSLFVIENKSLFRYDVHHHPWIIEQILINNMEVKYQLESNPILDRFPDLFHFSNGTNSLVWDKTFVRYI